MNTEELEEKIAKLEAELKSAKQSYQYYGDENYKLNKEIEGIHNILDNLVPCPPRGKDDEEHSWKNVTYSVITRLAIWLGSKQ